MNSKKGTYLLIFDDLRWFFSIFSTITVGLAVIYLLISIIFRIPMNTDAALFGPTYGGICTFAVAGLVMPFQVAIGLGSTRIQFLKSYNVMAILMVIGSITFLNLLYLLMNYLADIGLNRFKFYHPALLTSSQYHFLNYYWIDLMIGFFILGISSFIAVLIRRLGILNFLLVFVLISILLTFTSIWGFDMAIFKWIFNNNIKYTFMLIGIFGILIQLLTFPMMKNAPLKMKGRK